MTLEPIEPHIRVEKPPAQSVVIVRGGPLTVDKLVEHARRQQDRFSYRGLPMASVSVDATVGDWTLETILRDRLWSRSSFATTTVANVTARGFDLLPTFTAPHYDIVLPEATHDAAGTLLSVFGTGQKNPFRRRR